MPHDFSTRESVTTSWRYSLCTVDDAIHWIKEYSRQIATPASPFEDAARRREYLVHIKEQLAYKARAYREAIRRVFEAEEWLAADDARHSGGH